MKMFNSIILCNTQNCLILSTNRLHFYLIIIIIKNKKNKFITHYNNLYKQNEKTNKTKN